MYSDRIWIDASNCADYRFSGWMDTYTYSILYSGSTLPRYYPIYFFLVVSNHPTENFLLNKTCSLETNTRLVLVAPVTNSGAPRSPRVMNDQSETCVQLLCTTRIKPMVLIFSMFYMYTSICRTGHVECKNSLSQKKLPIFIPRHNPQGISHLLIAWSIIEYTATQHRPHTGTLIIKAQAHRNYPVRAVHIPFQGLKVEWIRQPLYHV